MHTYASKYLQDHGHSSHPTSGKQRKNYAIWQSMLEAKTQELNSFVLFANQTIGADSFKTAHHPLTFSSFISI